MGRRAESVTFIKIFRKQTRFAGICQASKVEEGVQLRFTSSILRAVAVLLAVAVPACGGGGGGSTAPAPVVTPTASPTPTHITVSPSPSSAATPVASAGQFACPSSSVGTTSAGRSAGSGTESRRRFSQAAAVRTNAPVSGRLVVTYNRATAYGVRSRISADEVSRGAGLVRELDFPALGTFVHVVSVDPSKIASVAAQLKTETGVKSVEPSGQRRRAAAVTKPYFPNDPYFAGFPNPSPTTAGGTAPPATNVGPFYESASVPGQWDMHVMKLEYALGYSQPNNGSSVTNTNLLGSSAKLAIIDTGEDTQHPDLANKIVYQKCFVTNLAGTAQVTSNFTTDPQGHGTNVTGIAAAVPNNGFGFTGAGYGVQIFGYRVFPTPDDSCATDTAQSAACLADPVDIASAINDAVAQHVNVISLSLGGGSCSGTANGGDDDPTEGAAIENAIANNVIVVASSGNSGTSGAGVSTPACDTGVIAAGASALDDGQPNGTGSTFGGTAALPVEYVPSYSQYGSPAAAPKSASAWGIVAPGGDGSGANDSDDLHWIENIWTTQPFDSLFSATQTSTPCSSDYQSTTGTTDCRVLIDGTSMSAPHVAGAAALIIAASGSAYQSPAAMKQLLCTTADDIGSSQHEGCGRVNVYRAMAVALGDPTSP